MASHLSQTLSVDFAEMHVIDAFGGGRLGHQIVMAFHRERREIGEPGEIACRREANGEGAAFLVLVEGGRRATPEVPVFGDAGVIVRPARRIGGIVQARDLEHQLASAAIGDAEMEPLLEFAVLVVLQAQHRARLVHGHHVDVAAVECAVDDDVAQGLFFNCYKEGKVRLLKAQDIQEIDTLYTDSFSDFELAKMAKKIIIVNDNHLIKCNTHQEFAAYFKK